MSHDDTDDDEALDRPYVVITLADAPARTFPLPLRHGRELQRRIAMVEPDPPNDLGGRIEAASSAKEKVFVPSAADESVMLAALDLPPEPSGEPLIALHAGLRAKSEG